MRARAALTAAFLACLMGPGPGPAATTAALAQVEPPAGEAPAGGLVLVADEALHIRAYEVTLALDQVTASYTIENTRAYPRVILSAFHLPEVDAFLLAAGRTAGSGPQAANFVDATVTAAGSPVRLQLQQRAQAIGLDITQDLIAAGIPLLPSGGGAMPALQSLPPLQRSELVVRGIVRLEDDRVQPAWSLRASVFWRQAFAPRRATTLVLSYRPMTGRGRLDIAALEALRTSHCLDAATETALAKRAAGQAGGVPAFWLTYAIGNPTGGSTPVDRFRLRISKPGPDALVATCFADLKVIGPTVLEGRTDRFVPDRDVAVLVVP